ncbi:ABC transporter permease [Fodinicola feengrottensis]|uniref:ABC transporter permease n=1 Tax=Fodinicola feengrottensis TaxID=435914 RepID=UPI0013D81A7E|nr:ABC transporter permease [Fodinicola feengrottensis]
MLVFAVSVYDLPVGSAFLLGAVVLVWGCTVLSLGFAVGAVVRTPSALSAIQDIGSFLMSGLAGGLIPLTTMPTWLQAIAPVSPAYWAISALRAALAGNAPAVWPSLAVVTLCGSAAAVIAYRRLR